VPALSSISSLHGRIQLRFAAPRGRNHDGAAGRRGSHPDPLHARVVLDLRCPLAEIRGREPRVLRTPGGGARSAWAPLTRRGTGDADKTQTERTGHRAQVPPLRRRRASPRRPWRASSAARATPSRNTTTSLCAPTAGW
jgi:hypothetical protein